MRKHIFLFVALLLAVIVTGAVIAQNPPPTPTGPRTDPQFGTRRNNDLSEAELRMEREREKRMNLERHESLKTDTDKLLELATELKKHVDNSNENLLSLEVVKKAEEIEKLAKKVKDKMKG